MFSSAVILQVAVVLRVVCLLFLLRFEAVVSGYLLASHADVLRGSSCVPAPRTSAELKDKFLSHYSQISGGVQMQIIGDPVGAVEVKVLTSQTHTYKLCRV